MKVIGEDGRVIASTTATKVRDRGFEARFMGYDGVELSGPRFRIMVRDYKPDGPVTVYGGAVQVVACHSEELGDAYVTLD